MKITIVSKMFCAVAVILSLASFTPNKKECDTVTTSKKVAFNAGLFQLANTSKIKLAVDKGTDERLRVQLKDKGGCTYYSEMYGKNEENYRRVFDLDGMNDGTYYFELSYGNQQLTKEVQIQTNRDRVVTLR